MPKASQPLGYDPVAGLAVNMPRGHSVPRGPIQTRWPARGVKVAEAMHELLEETGADAVITGFAEYPSRADEPLRSHGVRISKAPANFVDKRDRIGNALGWVGDIRVRDRHCLASLPYDNDKHGRTVLKQPVRLFKTSHDGRLCVIQLHPPTLGDSNPRVRLELCEQVIHVAQVNEAHDIPTLVLTDGNRMVPTLVRAGFAVGRLADVQGVLGWGMDFRGAGGTLKSHGIWTDHRGGSPWAVVRVPYFADTSGLNLELPSYG